MNRLTLEERKRANKIRCKLLYTIDRDIRESKKNNNNQILINSMTLQEIENKFLLFQNYKMKLSNTFTKTANKYMVMKTVDNISKKIYFYSDYLQDLKKENHSFVKIQRKKISANNIINMSYLVEPQEAQSPVPELFTNKMNIGEKKLIRKNGKKISFQKVINNRNNSNFKTIDLDIENKTNDEHIDYKMQTIVNKDKNKIKNNNINEDDSSSINSLTLELIQKKANFLSASINNKNKKELQRRKVQYQAIRKLRQFCFQKLKNKKDKRYITKSSHRNILYINNKFNDEDEKNNSNSSTKNNIKIGNKDKSKNTKINNSKILKKKGDTLNESRKRKITIKKNKDKKKINNNNNLRKQYRNNSTKKSPAKTKKIPFQRKSFILKNNIISGKLEKDILRFKKNKKEKNDNLLNDSQITSIEEDVIAKCNNQLKYKKMITDIIRVSLNDKNNNIINNNQLIVTNQLKGKNKSITFSDNHKPTKKNCSTNNFFNKRTKTKKNLYSSKNLINILKKYKSIKGTKSKSDRKRRYSIPSKDNKNNDNENDKNEQKSFVISNFDNKYDSKEKNGYNNNALTERRNQIWNIGKIEINNIYKVEEEDY